MTIFRRVVSPHATMWGLVLGLMVLMQLPTNAHAQTSTNLYETRRSELASIFPDGLIILPSESVEKKMEQPFWVQDPSFFYFTSLNAAPGAILLIDGPKNRSILFSGPDMTSFGVPLPNRNIANREDWIEQSGISAVLSISDFETFVQSRMDDGVQTIYLDKPRREKPSEVPPGFLEVSGFHRLWEQSLRLAFPRAQFGSASDAIDALIWIKKPFEIRQLRANAKASALALKRGMLSIHTAQSQRQAERAVVSACLELGMQGPSFWPWVMTGPNAHIQHVVASFYDPTHLNRSFEKGELVRVDVGCTDGGYGGDVGRTVPVSGTFTPEQALIWDALIAGYLGGIDVMKQGTTLRQVEEASHTAITVWATHHPERKAVAERMNGSNGVSWHLHGIGIESAETAQPILMAGTVIAFEPMFVWGADAYYLEDTILITEEGSEVLTPSLPYWSSEMHAFLQNGQ